MLRESAGLVDGYPTQPTTKQHAGGVKYPLARSKRWSTAKVLAVSGSKRFWVVVPLTVCVCNDARSAGVI
jgi:hypothetical protein